MYFFLNSTETASWATFSAGKFEKGKSARDTSDFSSTVNETESHTQEHFVQTVFPLSHNLKNQQKANQSFFDYLLEFFSQLLQFFDFFRIRLRHHCLAYFFPNPRIITN